MARATAVLFAGLVMASACAHPPRTGGDTPSSASLPRQATGPDQAPGWEVPLAATRGERDRCIDRELVSRHLNPFGDPEGTTYPGGSPLFGVAESTDRYEYVMRRRRDIATSCTRAPGEPQR